MAGLSREDFEFIRKLRKLGLLEDVAEHQLSLKNGVISCFCSDCDRSADIFEHTRSIVREQCKDPRIHMLADNGGPLLIPKDSPANKSGRTRDIDFLDSIEFAIYKTQIHTIALVGHAPCNIAIDREISLFDTMALTLHAKMRIKTDLGRYNPKVACFYHVDYGEHAIDPKKRMRTYFISRIKFFKYFRTFDVYLT